MTRIELGINTVQRLKGKCHGMKIITISACSGSVCTNGKLTLTQIHLNQQPLDEWVKSEPTNLEDGAQEIKRSDVLELEPIDS